MTIEGKQKPMYYIAEASNIENIKIAISKKEFSAKVAYLINTAENFCSIKKYIYKSYRHSRYR